jgi:hypothetical protein
MASATFYCCKGTSGAASGEAHSAPVTDATAPFGIAVDMSRYTTAGTRELYVDYRDTSGVMHEENYANFSINVAAPTVPTTASVTINWQAPTQRTDGTALTSTDLASFDVLYFDDATGTMRTLKVSNPASRSVQVTNLPKNTMYHFSITATDTRGATSTASEAVDLQL